MGKMKITTDHKWKQFKYSHEVPKKIMKNQFEHLDEETIGCRDFIKYRNYWYHTSDFTSNYSPYSLGSPFKGLGWDGYHSNSFFSGVLIKITDCGEEYKIGTYIS